MLKGTKKTNSKDTRLFVRLTEDEMNILEKLASHYNITKSELIRILIKNEANETFNRDTLHLLLT